MKIITKQIFKVIFLTEFSIKFPLSLNIFHKGKQYEKIFPLFNKFSTSKVWRGKACQEKEKIRISTVSISSTAAAVFILLFIWIVEKNFYYLIRKNNGN